MKTGLLKINSDITGLTTNEITTKISKRQTMNYAAAIKESNPFYFDDFDLENLVAPPLFPVVLSWPIFARIDAYLDFPYPPEIFQKVVHYTETIKYNRLIRPGEEVRINGEIAAVLPHKSGTYIVFEISISDMEGAWILSEYVGGLLRGIECGDTGRSKPGIPQLFREEQNQDVLWKKEISIDKVAPFVYDGCTNIVFDIHTSPRFAKAVGLPGIIVQGSAVFGYVVRELVNIEANGNPNAIKEVSGRFTDMVLPDSSIFLQLHSRKTSKTEKEFHFSVLNEQGNAAISDGYIKFSL